MKKMFSKEKIDLKTKNKKFIKREINQTLAITEIRKFGLNSLIVRWDPSDLQSTIGYAIFINKKLKSRIYNRMRNIAILDYLPLNSLFIVTIKEINSDGKVKQHGPSTVFKINY